MDHVRGACAQHLPMYARGVSSSCPTALQRYVTQRNDWKLEVAAQKVRAVNMKQSLRRPWYVRCVNMRLSLCLILWNIPKDHIDRRDTRSHLIQPAAKPRAMPKRSVLDLVCGFSRRRMTTAFPQCCGCSGSPFSLVVPMSVFVAFEVSLSPQCP